MSQYVKFLGAFIETQTNKGCSACHRRMLAKNRQMVRRKTFIIPKFGKKEFIKGRQYEVSDEVSDFLLELTYKDLDGKQKKCLKAVIIMRQKNKKCCKSCVLRIIRQEEKYDPIKFKNIGCDWIEVEQFSCIEHYQAQSEIDLLGINSAREYKFEGISQLHIFWIDVLKQNKKTDYNMTLGDYMYFCRTLWKLIGINEIEILNGCYMVKIIGERIYPREYRTLVLETEESDIRTEDDIDSFMSNLQQTGII